ncbi:MAG: hypothetical protein IJX49_05605 [Clostridia bacterium]|nr:hypothetical protein [Clostridia bacterium]
MKLEKREITLNERDSLLDMYFWERSIENEYKQGAKLAERKETELVLTQAAGETAQDVERMLALLRKAAQNKGSLLWQSENGE